MHKSCNQDKGDNVIEIAITEDYSICFDADLVVVCVEQSEENNKSGKSKKRNVMRFRPWHYYEHMHKKR